ncbi:MAG: hypothetical protein EPN76_01745 [Burkholderiaceae bacterium]|nr:MAG: hypothetical protein EPN76_01745 [Burkholderiaceae bacterium]
MSAISLDVPPLPMQGAALTIVLRELAVAPPAWMRPEIGPLAYSYDPGNSLTVGTGVGSSAEESTIAYYPRTALGKRLLALRASYLNRGGKLLSADALDEEMRVRRGDLSDA